MRIGEILIAAALVDAKKLQAALDYASSKSIPVGGALRALKFVDEADLKRSLDAQQAITRGLDPALALDILKSAHSNGCPYVQELKRKQSDMGRAKISDSLIYWLSAPDSLEATIIGGMKMTAGQIAPRSPEKLVIQGDMFYEANQLFEAEQAYVGAKQTWEEEYFPPKEKIVTVTTKLANLYLGTNRFDQAHEQYQRVLEMHRELSGKESVEVVRTLEDIGDLYELDGHRPQAHQTYAKALDILEKIPDEITSAGRIINKFQDTSDKTNPNEGARIGELATASGFLTEDQVQAALLQSKESGQPLGVALRKQGVLDGQQVESLMFAQTLVKQGTLLPPAAVQALKISKAYKIPLKGLADAGRWVSEEVANDPLYRQLLVEQERLLTTEGILGPNDPEVAALAVKVAEIHLQRKDKLSAEALFKRAVSIYEKAEAEKAQLLFLYDKLAQIQYQQGKMVDAQRALLKSLEYRRELGRGDSPEAAKCLWLLGKLGLQQRNRTEALSFLQDAKAVFDKLGTDQCPKQLMDEIAACAAAPEA
ncbi:MAG TPA: tetratricopeptide repeat protein [Candidatus Obscuribacterales bacterium]